MNKDNLGDYFKSISHVKLDLPAFANFVERLRKEDLIFTQVAPDRWEVQRWTCPACMVVAFPAPGGLVLDFYLMPRDTLTRLQPYEKPDGTVTLEEEPNIWPGAAYRVIRDGLLELGALGEPAAKTAAGDSGGRAELPFPWLRIPDRSWHQIALKLWWEGYSKPNIANRVPAKSKTIENVFSQLRSTYGTDIVPTADQLHKMRRR